MMIHNACMYKNHRCQLLCLPNVWRLSLITNVISLNETLSVLFLLLFLLHFLFDSTGCDAATDTGLVGCVVFVFVLDLHLDDVESLLHVSLRFRQLQMHGGVVAFKALDSIAKATYF